MKAPGHTLPSCHAGEAAPSEAASKALGLPWLLGGAWVWNFNKFMCDKFDKSPVLCGLGVEWIAMLAGHTTRSGDERKLITKCCYC